MKTFDYKGYDAAGRQRRGLVEALSLKEARERLAADGILAEALTVSGRKIRLAVAVRAVVYRELGALLRAGLPLVKAFDILVEAPEIESARVGLAGMRDRVREGVSLSQAFEDASPSVTPFEVSILEAAERSATVATVLDRLADFLDEQEQLKQNVQSALVYPAIVVTAGICVAILMLGLLIPRAQALLSGGMAELPLLTRIMIGVGHVLLRGGLPALVVVAVASVWFRRRLTHDAQVRLRWDRYAFGFPMVGRGYTLLVNERFSRTMALLLEGGVPLVEGLVIAGRATGSPWVAALSADEADAVRHGASLSAAVARIPPLSSFLPGWIRVGEAGGGMAALLDSAAHRYQSQWQKYIRTRLSVLEPIIILLIGAFVLLVTLAVLLPILKMTSGL